MKPSDSNLELPLGVCFVWAWFTGSTFPLVLTAAVGFARWVWRARKAWTPGGTFGLANLITAARLGLALAVGLVPTESVIPTVGYLLAVFFALDGLDGWAARRFETSSEFGAAFDTETDALMVATALLAVVEANLIGPWVLTVGLLRYVFVFAVKGSRRGPEPPRRSGRWAFSALMAGLIGASITASPLAVGVLGLGAVGVIVSFGRSFWWTFASRQPPRS